MDTPSITTPPAAPERACAFCGGSMEGKRKNARYCSDKCRKAKQYADNPEKRKKSVAKWYAENAEKKKKYVAKWYAENAEKRKAQSAKWYAENAEKKKKYVAKWHAENPEKKKKYAAKWRAEVAHLPSFKEKRRLERERKREENLRYRAKPGEWQRQLAQKREYDALPEVKARKAELARTRAAKRREEKAAERARQDEKLYQRLQKAWAKAKPETFEEWQARVQATATLARQRGFGKIADGLEEGIRVERARRAAHNKENHDDDREQQQQQHPDDRGLELGGTPPQPGGHLPVPVHPGDGAGVVDALSVQPA